MASIYFTLTNKRRVLVIPDTLAHLDGHAVITRTYSIFEDIGLGNPLLVRSKESTLHLEQIDDPYYFGFITFENPGKLFTYTAGGLQQLTPEEVTELIAHISNVRDNPAFWVAGDA